MVCWTSLLVMLILLHGWEAVHTHKDIRRLNFKVYDRKMTNQTVNGHAKPKTHDISSDIPGRTSNQKSGNQKFLVTWVPHLASNITVSTNKNYSLKDTNIIISVTQPQDNKVTTNKPMKTVLLSSRYHRPAPQLTYAPQYYFTTTTTPSTQSYRPLFNFLFTQKTTTRMPAQIPGETRPTYHPMVTFTQSLSSQTYKPIAYFSKETTTTKTPEGLSYRPETYFTPENSNTRVTYGPVINFSQDTAPPTRPSYGSVIHFSQPTHSSENPNYTIPPTRPAMIVQNTEPSVLSSSVYSSTTVRTTRSTPIPTTALPSPTMSLEVIPPVTPPVTPEEALDTDPLFLSPWKPGEPTEENEDSFVDNASSTTDVNNTWAEYLIESIEKIIRMLLPGLSPTGPQSYSMASLATVFGLPMLTGSLVLAGLGPLIVIAVAWLAPIGALMVLPGAAG